MKDWLLQGRIGRVQWWVGIVVLGAAQRWILEVSISQLVSPTDASSMVVMKVSAIAGFVGLLWLCGAMILSIKRVHDRDGRTIWLWLFAAATLVSLLADLASRIAPASLGEMLHQPSEILGWLLVAIQVLLAVMLGFLPGDPKPNRWGPCPRSYWVVEKPDNYRPPRID